jgi:hypothetical protein
MPCDQQHAEYGACDHRGEQDPPHSRRNLGEQHGEQHEREAAGAVHRARGEIDVRGSQVQCARSLDGVDRLQIDEAQRPDVLLSIEEVRRDGGSNLPPQPRDRSRMLELLEQVAGECFAIGNETFEQRDGERR